VPATLVPHHGQGGGDAVEDAADVHVDHPVPLLDSQRRERRKRHHPGVVDDHVDPAPAFPGGGHEGPHVGGVGDVQAAERRVAAAAAAAAAVRGDVLDELFQPVRAPRAKEQPVAVGGQAAGGGRPDAAARSGDQYDLRVVRHACFSSR
jgi:hypothetical protein